MKIFTYTKIAFLISSLFLSLFLVNKDSVQAQEIPELHMIVLQGDVFINNVKTPQVDGLILEARIGNESVGQITVGELGSSRFSGFEIGPLPAKEGSSITFWLGDEKAIEQTIFGQLTPSGQYCAGCTWSLPISRIVDLHFQQFPLSTPTPVPDKAEPTFITGNLIFGSMLSAPEGFNTISALIEGELVGTGSVEGPDFSITIDPGDVSYIGKQVVFKIGESLSKTTYTFVENGFITDFKIFFPQYVAPTPTPTVVAPPMPTQIPTPTSTPEPTRTPTPVPQPTATYTATPTPTPIVLSTSDNNSQIILEDSDTGGCNSRGGGAASLSLIVLSAAPLYLLNRRRRKS